MTAAEQLERMRYFLCDDEEALDFVSMFFGITQIWDDLHDADRVVDRDTVNEAFEGALVHLAADPFYIRHFSSLYPLVVAGINAWQDSNALVARGGLANLALAHVLRDCVGEVAIASARIVGGHAWMREVSLAMRLEIINDEPFELYAKEHGHEC